MPLSNEELKRKKDDFEKMKSALESYCLYSEKHFHHIKIQEINNNIDEVAKEIRPIVKMGNQFRIEQKEKRAKRQAWGGLTKEQIKERNQIIIARFTRSKFTSNHFADKYQNEFQLKPTQIRNIIRAAKKP